LLKKEQSMTLSNRSLAGLVLSAGLLAAWTGGAQEPQPQPKPTVGDKVDSAVQSLKRGAKDATEAVRQQYEKARTSVHGMGVSARVYGRLHWDKALTDAKLDVDVRDGVATLSGTVGDAVARAKAVDLTKDTVGVNRVVDRLVVQTTTSTVTPAKP